MTTIQTEASSSEVLEISRGWWLLIGLCLAQFMVALDATVVNVALPSMSASLHLGPSAVQWVATSYLLCTGGFMLLGGRAADRLGRRRMLLAGLLVFSAASAASGLAGDATVLIAARAAQGLGAALLSPAALSTITSRYEGERQAAALSAWGAVGATGFVGGMLFGGMLTSWASWHWVFYINVPVGVALVLALPRHLPTDRTTFASFRNLTPAGPIVITAGLASLVYGISTGQSHGWGSTTTVAALVVGALLVAGFAVLERSPNTESFVPAELWRNRPLLSGTGLMLGATGILAAP